MRLDHLLSKEHTPRCQANVLARMVVFTSGIVDDRMVSCVQLVWVWGAVWLLMALRWWGMGSSTLLGPEGSAVLLLSLRGRGCVVGLLFLPLPGIAVGWSRVLVGLLFEICIVDASIFVACPSPFLVVGVVALHGWPFSWGWSCVV